MNGNAIYHVYLGNEKHYDFGSVAAIYDRLTPEQLGVSLSRLWSFGIAPGRPYKNKRCTIYRGVIQRKKGRKQI